MGAIFSQSLFCKEQWERLAHGRSFLKSGERELLKVTHKKVQFWAKERKSEKQKKTKSEEQKN